LKPPQRRMQRTPLRQNSKSPVAQCKVRIQALLRAIAIIRDGGCWVRLFPDILEVLGPCNDVLQYHHLNSGARNISYGDSRLGVCACRRHHYFHDTSYEKDKKELY